MAKHRCSYYNDTRQSPRWRDPGANPAADCRTRPLPFRMLECRQRRLQALREQPPSSSTVDGRSMTYRQTACSHSTYDFLLPRLTRSEGYRRSRVRSSLLGDAFHYRVSSSRARTTGSSSTARSWLPIMSWILSVNLQQFLTPANPLASSTSSPNLEHHREEAPQPLKLITGEELQPTREDKIEISSNPVTLPSPLPDVLPGYRRRRRGSTRQA